MNAEITTRLEESLDSANDLAALKQKMLEIEAARAVDELRISQLNSDLIVAHMLVTSLAALAKDDLKSLSPAYLEQLEKIIASEDDILLRSIENKLEKLLATKKVFDSKIASGQIQLVDGEEGETTPLGQRLLGEMKSSLRNTKELEAMLEKTGYKMSSSKKDGE